MQGLLAQNIKKARLKMGISQMELSKQVNMHRNTIINFESGRRNPKVKDLIKIANALKVSISELIS